MNIQHELNKAKVILLMKQIASDSSELTALELLAMILIAEILEKDPEVETEILNDGSKTENCKKNIGHIFHTARKEREHIEKSLIIANRVAEKFKVNKKSFMDKYIQEYDDAEKNGEI